MEANETILCEIVDKRKAIEDLKQRISNCSKYCNQYVDMKLQLSHLKDMSEVNPATLQEYERLKTMIDQQKLQLQSDVHFIIEKEVSFLSQAGDIVHFCFVADC